MYALIALAAFQAASGIQQAEMIRAQARVQDEINNMNADWIDYDASQQERYGQTQTARYQSNVDQTVASQKAGYIDQGVDSNFGTAADVQAETKATGFLNTLDIQSQAQAKALGLRQQARSMRLQGSMGAAQAQMNASGAMFQGFTQAATTGFRAYSETQPGTSKTSLGKSNKTASSDFGYSGYSRV